MENDQLKKTFRVFRKEQIIISILSFFEYGLMSYVAFNMQYLFDFGTNGQFDELKKLALILILIVVVVCIVNYLGRYMWLNLVDNSIAFLRIKVFGNLLKKPYLYFVTNSSGDLLSKVMNDVIIYAQNMSIGLLMLLINIFRVFVVLIGMFLISIKLTLYALLAIPLYYLIYRALNKKVRIQSGKEREEFGKLSDDVVEKINAFEIIKIYKKEELFKEKFVDKTNKYLKFRRNLNNLAALKSVLNEFLTTVIPIFMIIIGFFYVVEGNISTGQLISFYALVPFLIEPIVNLTDHALGRAHSIGMKERISEFTSNENSESGLNISTLESITLENVSVSYNETKVLDNVSLSVKPGDRIAVLGKTGAGKSTLIKVITGLLETTEGSVFVNDIDLANINKRDYYDMVSYLPQHPFIFSDTIENNITMHNEYNENRLYKAISWSKSKMIVEAYEEGVKRMIREVGKDLSGGEKQRISLARSMVRNSNLVIFDEPTSALDSDTEKMVVEGIGEYLTHSNNNIFIAITHRANILELCNKILFVKNSGVELYDYNGEEVSTFIGELES